MNWIIWAFGGIGSTIIGLLLGKSLVKSSKNKQKAKAGNQSIINQVGRDYTVKNDRGN